MHIYTYFFSFYAEMFKCSFQYKIKLYYDENNSVRGLQFRNGIITTYKRILHQQTDIWSCGGAEL